MERNILYAVDQLFLNIVIYFVCMNIGISETTLNRTFGKDSVLLVIYPVAWYLLTITICFFTNRLVVRKWKQTKNVYKSFSFLLYFIASIIFYFVIFISGG